MFINTDFLKDNKIQLILEKTVDGNIMKEWVPAYHFAICDNNGIKAFLVLSDYLRNYCCNYIADGHWHQRVSQCYGNIFQSSLAVHQTGDRPITHAEQQI